MSIGKRDKVNYIGEKKYMYIYISEYSRIGKTDLKIEDWITFCQEVRAL